MSLENDDAISVQADLVNDGKPSPDEMRALLGMNASADSGKSSIWSEFDDVALIPYTEYWDNNKTLGENYLSLINRCVLLPNRDVQAMVAASYAAVHSVACRVLPTLSIIGATGTGKSALTKVLSGVREQHGTNTFGSSSTFASLRNAVNIFRFKDHIDNEPVFERENELPCLMVIADIKEFFFKGDDGAKKFALFRCGWDRSEEVQTISKGNGENITFYTFCPKILSTVDTFVLKPEFAELYRRSLFIKTEHIDRFNPQEKAAWYGDTVEALEPDSISWKGCNEEFLNFWHGDNNYNLMEFAKLRRQHGNLKKQALLSGITEHQFKGAFDVMCTAKLLFNLKPSEVIELFLNYFQYIKENVIPESEGITKMIQLVTSDWTTDQERALKEIAASGLKVELPKLKIKASEFKSKFDWYRQQQGVMFGASESAISSAMGELGFHLEKIDKAVYWVWNK